MLTYSFSDLGSDRLYEHLYKCIKNDILQGNLTANVRLPSKRSFAKNLNISTITVENAYAQLMAEGYIYSISKKGYFVSDINNAVRKNQESTPESIRPAVKQEGYLADFLSNHNMPDHFPFSIWAKLMREVISNKNEELMINAPSGGIMELRQAIAGYLLQFRGMNVSPEQIIVGAGTEYLYGLLIQLLGRDRVYGLEEPGYRKIAQIYNSNQVKCHYIPMDEQGVSMVALEEKDTDVIHISPSHHYPTGIVTPVSRRYELLGWAARRKGRYIIEDDYDCEFRFLGKPIPSLQSIDVSEKVIYMNTFTKSLASTIRISYMVLPPHLLNEFYEKLGFYSCTVSNFEQYTLARFIHEGYFEKHINRMRNFYRRQRDQLLNAIAASSLAARVSIREEESGLHFLMHVDTELPDEVIVERAASRGIRISCLSQYYNKEEPPGHVLIVNYSGIDSDRIAQAVELLGECF